MASFASVFGRRALHSPSSARWLQVNAQYIQRQVSGTRISSHTQFIPSAYTEISTRSIGRLRSTRKSARYVRGYPSSTPTKWYATTSSSSSSSSTELPSWALANMHQLEPVEIEHIYKQRHEPAGIDTLSRYRSQATSSSSSSEHEAEDEEHARKKYRQLSKSWSIFVDDAFHGVAAVLNRKSRFVTKDVHTIMPFMEALQAFFEHKWQGTENKVNMVVMIVGESKVCSKARELLLEKEVRIVEQRGALDEGSSVQSVRYMKAEPLVDSSSSVAVAKQKREKEEGEKEKEVEEYQSEKSRVRPLRSSLNSSPPSPVPRLDESIDTRYERRSVTGLFLSGSKEIIHPPPAHIPKKHSHHERITNIRFRSHKDFILSSRYSPAGDQPQAIEKLYRGLEHDQRFQLLMGATGTGKTFVMANVISKAKVPTLVLAPNKTLAAQLYREFREFLPHNSVEYFVSYYDFFLPEAYNPSSDVYIAKRTSINEDLDRLRHSATASLYERSDIVVVCSVSCLYGLGMPEEYLTEALRIATDDRLSRSALIEKLLFLQYKEVATLDVPRIEPGSFVDYGDHIDISVPWKESILYRITLGQGRVSSLGLVVEGSAMNVNHMTIYPARHFITPPERLAQAIESISDELKACVDDYKIRGLHAEAARLRNRVDDDIRMLKEVGYCSGVENYSRHLSGKEAGATPSTLLDYFPRDFLLIVDESHITVPQIRGMFDGNVSRKASLVRYGFRLPSAFDNRPLNHVEFWSKISKCIFVSATPTHLETAWTKLCGGQIVHLINRPTGVLDPEIEVRPSGNQIDDLVKEIQLRKAEGHAVLITTVTKKMSEDLSEYLSNYGDRSIRVAYIHSEVNTLGRVEVLENLRKGTLDVVVGVNLLREGIDLPCVSLVVILDADKEGFLRSQSALIQTIGRAARHVEGKVIMYADKPTFSMQHAIDITRKRRQIQMQFNEKMGRKPTPLHFSRATADDFSVLREVESFSNNMPRDEGAMTLLDRVDQLRIKLASFDFAKEVDDAKRRRLMEKEMTHASERLDYETAAAIRDLLKYEQESSASTALPTHD